jgi:hypothetical protein
MCSCVLVYILKVSVTADLVPCPSLGRRLTNVASPRGKESRSLSFVKAERRSRLLEVILKSETRMA